MATPGDRNT